MHYKYNSITNAYEDTATEVEIQNSSKLYKWQRQLKVDSFVN